MKSWRAPVFGALIVLTMLWLAAYSEPESAKVSFDPPGCYVVSTGRGSTWMPRRMLQPAPSIADSGTQHFAFVQEERDVFSSAWGVSFVADSTRTYGQQASWSRVDSTETRLRFFNVDWGWRMQLTSPRKDTLEGLASFDAGLLPVRSRVKLARISCQSAYITTPSGLSYHMLSPGGKDSATLGSTVSIQQVVTLTNGQLISDTHSDSTPIIFEIGAHRVSRGVEEGVLGMRVDEMRRLLVPASLSDRTMYPPNTPPDSILRIEIRLMDVKRSAKR